jgi:hypothetical protein
MIVRDLYIPHTPSKTNISYAWGTPGDVSTVYGTEEVIPHTKTFSMDYESKTMNDYVVPRFKTRSAKGEIFNNPLVSTRTIYKDLACTRIIKRLNAMRPDSGQTDLVMPVGYIYDGEYSSSYFIGINAYALNFSDVPNVDATRLQQLAVTGAHANVDFSEASLYETFGEMDETVAFVRHTFKRALKIFRAVKKFDLKLLRKEIKPQELADRYMECRYAIRPLVYDVRNAVAAFTVGIPGKNRFTFRDTETETLADMRTYEGGNSMFEMIKLSRKTVNCRAGVLTELRELSQTQIWGLDKPLEAMLELTSFSFIADWFFNIGQTLSSFTPNPGVKELASWVTTVEHSYCEITAAPFSNSYETYTYADSYSCSGLHLSKEVIATTRTPSPTKSIMPKFVLRLNAFKLLDLAIIAKTLFSKDRDKALKVAMYKRS